MKKFIMIPLLLISGIGMGCDFCNCYLGLDPGYNKNSFGLRWDYIQTSFQHEDNTGFKTMHGGSTGGSESEKVKQYFNSVELFARYYPVPKLQIIATLPYSINTIETDDNIETGSALSDISIIGMYQLANTKSIDSAKIRHRVFGGLGIKFPTGKSTGSSEFDIPFSYDLYSGTGSTDYLFLFSYFGKKNHIGWNIDLNYKLNGQSSNDYKFGNTFNSSQRLFYEFRIKSSTLLPHISFSEELSDKDEFEETVQDETGGNIFWSGAGIDFYFGNFSITSEVRLPVHQTIDDSLPETKLRVFSSINFHF